MILTHFLTNYILALSNLLSTIFYNNKKNNNNNNMQIKCKILFCKKIFAFRLKFNQSLPTCGGINFEHFKSNKVIYPYHFRIYHILLQNINIHMFIGV